MTKVMETAKVSHTAGGQAAPDKAGAKQANPSRVRVFLPPLPGGSDVVEVGYNGQMFLLQRGRSLQVPRPLYDILLHAGLVNKEGE